MRIAPPSTPPPLSPYGTFTGQLFQYSSSPSLIAFESSPPPSTTTPITTTTTKKCILLGGLSDGPIPTPYTKLLESACHEHNWSLVQPVLSSSYLGFGNGSLERDTEEICKLMTYLECHHGNNGEGESSSSFALVGHSTGCQNSVHFVKFGQEDLVRKTKVIALQAPVSDREGPNLKSSYQSNIDHARNLKSQGKEDEMMPRSAFWAPITASRFLALQDVNGEDDFFSSDLSEEEMEERLGHMGEFGGGDGGDQNGMKVLVAYSGEDEYVPEFVDKKVLLERMCRAMNSKCSGGDEGKVAIPLYLSTGNHNLSKGEGDAERFVEAVSELLSRVP